MLLKRMALRLVGEPFAGMIDDYRFPERRRLWGGAL